MTCTHCKKAETKTYKGGVWNATCLGCCVRVVVSARPDRALQEAMLASIARHPKAPKRELILQKLKETQ